MIQQPYFWHPLLQNQKHQHVRINTGVRERDTMQMLINEECADNLRSDYIYMMEWHDFFLINLFIYFWLCWIFIAVHRLSLFVASRGHFSSCSVLVSNCVGFSCCRAQALEHQLGSCGVQAQLPRGRWDLLRPGNEPMSPALASEFLTTGPLGKSIRLFF